MEHYSLLISVYLSYVPCISLSSFIGIAYTSYLLMNSASDPIRHIKINATISQTHEEVKASVLALAEIPSLLSPVCQNTYSEKSVAGSSIIGLVQNGAYEIHITELTMCSSTIYIFLLTLFLT